MRIYKHVLLLSILFIYIALQINTAIPAHATTTYVGPNYVYVLDSQGIRLAELAATAVGAGLVKPNEGTYRAAIHIYSSVYIVEDDLYSGIINYIYVDDLNTFFLGDFEVVFDNNCS